MKALTPIRPVRSAERGLTMVELIVTVTILTILAGAAFPITVYQSKRLQERVLRYDLWTLRDAIDRYKDGTDKGYIETKLDSQGYPEDLETLAKDVKVKNSDKKVRFLRSIPVDPMTGKADWGMRSMQDDPKSESFSGQSVFDVYSKSTGTALDGSKYSDW
jgi:general secretion pathway protein G